MASSINPVATIWLSAPSSNHGQNAAEGTGTWSPVAINTAAKKTSENGNPNRKRILVAPQVPSGPVSDRCIALRATCPSAAMMVKGIQSVAMLNIGGFGRVGGMASTVPGSADAVNSNRVMTGLRVTSTTA